MENLNNSNSYANNLNEITFKGIDIRIGDLNFDKFVKFKYQFMAKNQVFGTCWANAYSAGIFLANKRVLGRVVETFESYRENLIRLASSVNIDEGWINNENVKKFFENNKLHFKKVEKKEAINAIKKGRFIVFSFRLNDKQWNNFKRNGSSILTEAMLNKGCRVNNNKSDPPGHSVLLIEITGNYFRFLNSWGSSWGDAGTFKVENPEILKPYKTEKKPIYYDIFFSENELTEKERKFYSKNIDYIRSLISDFDQMSIIKINDKMNELYRLIKSKFLCEYCNKLSGKDEFKIYIIDGVYKMACPFCNSLKGIDDRLKKIRILESLLHDGNKDFDINFKEDYSIHIDRANFHKKFKINNQSDNCSIGSENPFEQKIDSLFIKEVFSIICLENGKFVASGSNMILVFGLILKTIEDKIIPTEYKDIIMRNIINDDLWTLCDLKIGDLFASGGEDLKIFKINYGKHELNLQFRFNDNQKINKIILINSKNLEIIKRIVVCDKNEYIGFYDIKNLNNNNINISFSFKKKCHNSPINCILYLSEEELLVARSKGDQKLTFWKIQDRNLIQFLCLNNATSIISNDSLLDINGNLLVGEKNGINVFHHKKKDNGIDINFSFFFKNEEFGGVFSMKSLENNYFICGRSFGFCSVFLLREKSIRKINIYRNNNLRASDKPYDIYDVKYRITSICVQKTSEKNGNILISSIDKTLKVYCYQKAQNNFIDNN